MSESNSSKISNSVQEENDTNLLNDRPFYQRLVNTLDLYDLPKKGKFMKYYNGLLGRPDAYNRTAKFVCWDKKIFSRKMTTWELKEAKSIKDDGIVDIDMNHWGEVKDEYRNKIDFFGNGVPFNFGKLLYCFTMKLFLFPFPQLLFILLRFTAIFLNIIIKAFIIIFAFVGNLVNSIASIFDFGVYNPLRLVAMIISFVNYFIMNILKAVFSAIGYFTSSRSNFFINDLEDSFYKYKYGYTYRTMENVDGSGVDSKPIYPGIGDVIYAYLGLALPIGQFNSAFAVKYGSGGLLMLILVIMAISAVVIFVGGSSITVAFVGFLMYIFKVIKMLGDFKTEETSSSDNKKN